MKRIALVALSVLAVSTYALAQAPAPTDDVDKALLAAPATLREGATVISWKPDYTYETLKKGTNHLVCYDLSGKPERQPFMIECTNTGNLERVAQDLKFESAADKTKTQALLDAAEKDGTRLK